MPDQYDLRLNTSSSAGGLFSSLETHPGQVYSTPTIMSKAQEVRMARGQVIRQARHIERGSEYIRSGIDAKVDMVVGASLTAKASPDWEALGITDPEEQKKVRQSIDRVFREWAEDPRLLQDGEGHYDFGGMMWLAMRQITGPDGECFLVVRYNSRRAERFRHPWATYVTVIDPDRVETPPSQQGNPRVKDGKVFDADGRCLGFYVRKKHPSDEMHSTSDNDFVLVRREEPSGRPVGIHWFPKTRPGQIRGLSTLVTVLKQTGMFDQFKDAYLGAAVINQMLATWIKSELSPKAIGAALAPSTDESVGYDPWTLFNKKTDYYNKVKMKVNGVRIPVLPPGDEINMSAVNRAIQDPSAFANLFLREFASALGVSFEQISKNFSDANYSAARASLLDVWKGVMKMRHWFGRHVASLVYSAVIEEAIKKGRVYLPAGAKRFDEARAAWTRCTWVGPAMPQIDPEKDARAAKELIDAKLESRTFIIAQRGREMENVFEEIAIEREEAENHGYSLNTKQEDQRAIEEAKASATPDEQTAQDPKKKKKTQPGQRDGDGDGVINENEVNN